MWFEESNMYFSGIENFPNREINQRNFSNPHLLISCPPELLTSTMWTGIGYVGARPTRKFITDRTANLIKTCLFILFLLSDPLQDNIDYIETTVFIELGIEIL